MPVPSRITYTPEVLRLTPAQQVEALAKLSFRHQGVITAMPTRIWTPDWPWDANVCLPLPALFGGSSGPAYHFQLEAVVETCRRALAAYQIRVDSYVEFNETIRLRPETAARYGAIARSDGEPRLYGWMQLGRRFGGHAPAEVAPLLSENEIVLDPATVLLYLTLTVLHAKTARVLQPMWIDCPGAEYDPEGKGKFSDCPRWNVSTDPSDKDVAFLSLDWNWGAGFRARANHGSATILLEP